MPVFCLELKTDSWANHRFVINSSSDDAAPIIESFAALVATGQIEIRHIQHRYPESELFNDIEDKAIDHSYEVMVNAKPRLYAAPTLKNKSALLVQLEAAAETERTQPNDDLAAAE